MATKPDGQQVMAEDAQPDSQPQGQPQPGDDQPQTVELPMSAVGQAKQGDTITLTVVSVDEQNGVINATVAPKAEAAGGSDELASKFDDEKGYK